MAKVFEKEVVIKKLVLAVLLVVCSCAKIASAAGCAELFPAPPSEKFRIKAGEVYIKGVDENGKLGLRVMVKDALDNQNVAAADAGRRSYAQISAVESDENGGRQVADIFAKDNKVTVLYYGNSEKDSYYAIYENEQVSCGALPKDAKTLLMNQYKAAGNTFNQATLKIDGEEKIAGLFGLNG